MIKNTLVLLAVCMSSQLALADDAAKMDSAKKMPAMTTEQRQKMADAHEKMATCLRSDKPMSGCHEEMMKSCQEGMGKDGCPMMGGKGMHSHSMMHQDDSDSKSPKHE